jgi:hypothetical protein
MCLKISANTSVLRKQTRIIRVLIQGQVQIQKSSTKRDSEKHDKLCMYSIVNYEKCNT